MNEKTLEAITRLAEKLGTTAEYLWGVLLKQAPIAGVVDIAVGAIWIVFAVMWFRFVQQKTTKKKTTDENLYSSAADWEDEGAFLGWFSVFVIVCVSVVVVSSNFKTAVEAILSPEYWAIKQILK